MRSTVSHLMYVIWPHFVSISQGHTWRLRPNMNLACTRPARAMRGTLALMTSVSFQLYEKAMA